MDVLDVREAAIEAVNYCRSKQKPFILEVKTYRFRGHSMSDPAKYRTREEVQKMREEQDPIEYIKKKLLDLDIFDKDRLQEIDDNIRLEKIRKLIILHTHIRFIMISEKIARSVDFNWRRMFDDTKESPVIYGEDLQIPAFIRRQHN